MTRVVLSRLRTRPRGWMPRGVPFSNIVTFIVTRRIARPFNASTTDEALPYPHVLPLTNPRCIVSSNLMLVSERYSSLCVVLSSFIGVLTWTVKFKQRWCQIHAQYIATAIWKTDTPNTCDATIYTTSPVDETATRRTFESDIYIPSRSSTRTPLSVREV